MSRVTWLFQVGCEKRYLQQVIGRLWVNSFPLGTKPDCRQALVALLGMLLCLSIFIALERTVTPRYNWVLPLDEWIPFIPVSWCVYVLFFPFVLVAAAYAPAEAFKAFTVAVWFAFIVAVGCFLMLPESLPRPDIGLVDNAFLRQRFARLWQLDQASNGFPSLHVAVTCLACRALWASRYRWLVGGLGVLISLSTLTVKQHTLVDVAGGALLALGCALVTQRQPGKAHAHG